MSGNLFWGSVSHSDSLVRNLFLKLSRNLLLFFFKRVKSNLTLCQWPELAFHEVLSCYFMTREFLATRCQDNARLVNKRLKERWCFEATINYFFKCNLCGV